MPDCRPVWWPGAGWPVTSIAPHYKAAAGPAPPLLTSPTLTSPPLGSSAKASSLLVSILLTSYPLTSPQPTSTPRAWGRMTSAVRLYSPRTQQPVAPRGTAGSGTPGHVCWEELRQHRGYPLGLGPHGARRPRVVPLVRAGRVTLIPRAQRHMRNLLTNLPNCLPAPLLPCQTSHHFLTPSPHIAPFPFARALCQLPRPRVP